MWGLSTLLLAEFKLQTGGGRYADEILQEIIDQAEREINGWITIYGLTATVTKAASSLLSKAGYLERLYMDGALPGEDAAKYYNLDKKAENLRSAAKALYIVDETTAPTTSTSSSTSYYVVKKANA